jgi:hypothetical protein
MYMYVCIMYICIYVCVLIVSVKLELLGFMTFIKIIKLDYY